MFSFDLSEWVNDDLIESVYRKIKSGNGGCTEAFQKVEPSEIDYTPLDFSPYQTELDLTNAFFGHYMIVLRDGFIPPEYLTPEK